VDVVSEAGEDVQQVPIGLVVDWGGVLTGGLGDAFGAWAAAEGIEYGHYLAALRTWIGPDAVDAAENPVHALERGELEVPDFERRLAVELSRHGSTVSAPGLLQRMFTGLELVEGSMVGLVRRARAAGLRTALLSNSWGNAYPREGWDTLFDAVVISGEVGMRKPEPRIYLHTLELLGLAPEQAVMVDDLRPNVAAAVAVGMVGVLHESYEQTRLELEAVFRLDLSEGLESAHGRCGATGLGHDHGDDQGREHQADRAGAPAQPAACGRDTHPVGEGGTERAGQHVGRPEGRDRADP
jgi:epoxide hydrolase-like predicted phosphatase